MTNVSLSDDGSSSNHSRSNNINAVEQLKAEPFVPEALRQPTPPWEGQEQPRRKKDISLDHLIQLRAPASTVIAEPLPTISALTSASMSNDLELRPSLAGARASRCSGPPSSDAPLRRKPTSSLPPLSPASCRRSSKAVSRAPSTNSLGTHHTGEFLSEAYLSFEFEAPIDPMISLTTSFSLGQHYLRSDSLHMSELDRAEDDKGSLHWSDNYDSGAHCAEVRLLMAASSQSFEGRRHVSVSGTRAPGQLRGPGSSGGTRLTPSSEAGARPDSVKASTRNGKLCPAQRLLTSSLDGRSPLPPPVSVVLEPPPRLRYDCSRPLPSPLGSRLPVSPYVDLQLLVRAQADDAIRG